MLASSSRACDAPAVKKIATKAGAAFALPPKANSLLVHVTEALGRAAFLRRAKSLNGKKIVEAMRSSSGRAAGHMT
jgi:hypothetical protein